MPGQFLEVHRFGIPQPHINHIAIRIGDLTAGPTRKTVPSISRCEPVLSIARLEQTMRLMGYVLYIVHRMDQTLGDQKTCRQFTILSGRPHHHRNTLTFNPYFQWFLGGQKILVVGFPGSLQPSNRHFPDPVRAGIASDSLGGCGFSSGQFHDTGRGKSRRTQLWKTPPGWSFVGDGPVYPVWSFHVDDVFQKETVFGEGLRSGFLSSGSVARGRAGSMHIIMDLETG